MKRGRAIAAAPMIIALLASTTVYAVHSDIAFSPAVPRYGGLVTEIGAPDGNGGVHRFRARQVGPYYAPERFPPGALRGWRLTFVGGERFAKTFEVMSNTDHEFVVKALDVPFDGVAVNDMFLVEDINSAEPIK
jgi:hypothetical protein